MVPSPDGTDQPPPHEPPPHWPPPPPQWPAAPPPWPPPPPPPWPPPPPQWPAAPPAWWPAASPAAPSRAGPARSRRRGAWRRRGAIAVTAIVGAACLAGAAVAAVNVRAELVRKPTAAELSRAAATEVARRWAEWPAGKIFPASLPFTADLAVTERAVRVGIDHPPGCAAAVDQRLRSLLTHGGCRGALRATYVDERQAVVFTVGILAFPSQRAAVATWARIGKSPGLRALAIAGTASAWFSNGARQAATVSGGGPYLVLTTAGYADGRLAGATGEPRPAVFAPASQLAAAILAPLAAPAYPRCGEPGWTC